MARGAKIQDDRPRGRRIGTLAALGPFLRPYRMQALAALVALVATSAISLILPLAVRRVIDNFDNGAGLLDRYFAAALLIVLGLAVGTAARYYFVSRLGERVVADIRKAVHARVITLAPAYFEKVMTGEILSRITTDTTLIQSVIGSSLSIALRNLLLLIGGLGLLAWTSIKLAGLVLLIVPGVMIPIIVLGRRLRELSRRNQDWIAASSGAASESLLAAQTIQAFTHEDRSIARFDEVTERAFDTALSRIGTRAVMTAIVIFLIFAGVIGVLWIGARDVQSGAMTAGQLVQFVIYSVLVAGAVGALSEIWGELQRAAGATERLAELLQADDSLPDPTDPRPLPVPVQGRIAFEGVAFHFPSRPDLPALAGMDLRIEPGETVALVGPSGAGKTTIIQMIQRFWDPQSGRVTLDGIDLRDMARRDFRARMALVPQDPVIFAASAAENIRLGRPEASDEEVADAARAAHAHDFIVALPQGYDTPLGERGVTLSGGQRQRIAIARAILRDAPVLLLDEATSALDAQSEALVQEAITRLTEGRTTIVVAHRLATVKKADRIVVMESGRIVAQGRHEDLVAEGGLYADLARMQFTDGATA
ncbi:ABC transporter transmembrane domain-containing protein [Paracoccus sp. 1_MG-2023]|uniref:ABC transporter transmembrane domain-containing protein n=1 Tax=unclassified Paracoccus (in: a-proteobacteria) TaxID=2688777 RepID=UPI001C081072|nr:MULTISPECIES: ABC transporter transmembrane domain-containing protein [unclassified Paracoccus (in: a-proteobacteria)]MBU2956305.1 ATP-binding cassette domain-containing protein [Paracoccus sp. C2R09]MDO6667981.1 ABC transporter transmembrane domain-containing protein [Paracoccus sp. 1_MG-2023]